MNAVAAPSAPRPDWAQVPPPGSPPRGRWDLVPVAAFVALVGPFVEARFWPPFTPWRVTLIGALALLLMMALPRRWWVARGAVAAGAALLVLLPQGRVLAIWLGAGLLLAVWVAQDAPPLPFLPRPGPGAAGPVMVFVGVAAWQAARGASPIGFVVPFGLACLMPLAAWLGHGVLDRIGRRVGHAVGAAVSAVLFVVLGALVVLVPWSVQRVLRRDPLRPPDGWRPRERRELRPSGLWAPEPRPDRVSLAPVALLALALLLVVGWVVVQRGGTPSSEAEVSALLRPPPPDPTPPGSWYPEYRQDVAWALTDGVALDTFQPRRLLDVRTRTVNVTDGHRVSWTPPPSGDARTIRVWIYGGNGAFGFEQRDDHTIASELARAADSAGLRLEVSNRGVPGQAHWRASQRFAEDLATERTFGGSLPDLVIFYDGFEDVLAAEQLVERGLGDVRAPYEAFGEQAFDRIVNDGDGATPPPTGVESLGWPTVPGMPVSSVGELAVRRYERARRSTIDRARQAGIPVVFAWQAARTSGDGQGRYFAEAERFLPPDVLDLVHSLDGGGADWVDDVHHGEEGAGVVAAELLPAVRRPPSTAPVGGS
ncbi:MAG: hypothetical protein ACOYOQ_16435 [Microthrixaceae bacterium]